AASGNYHAVSRPGPTLELPGSPDANGIPNNNLRAAKSFADLRSYSPSPAPSTSSYVNPLNPPPVHVSRYGDYTSALNQTGSMTTPSLTPSTPGNAINTPARNIETTVLVNTMSSMGLGFEPGNTLNRPRDAPGAIGSQRPGVNGSSNRSAPERQPR